MIDLFNEGWTTKEVAREFGMNFETLKKLRQRKLNLYIKPVILTKVCEHCGDTFSADVSHRYKKYCNDACRNKSYMKNNFRYESSCKICEAHIVSYHERKFCSSACLDADVEESKEKRMRLEETEKEQRLKLSAIKKLSMSLERLAERKRVCPHCSEEFHMSIDGASYKYCGNCYMVAIRENRRIARRGNSRDKRWRTNGKPDYSINLLKLHQKDNGICYLCNEQTDYEDMIVTSEGYYIAGGDYPSIDHVIPIAKGGLHQWENVKLAHRRCNYIKSDN